MKEEVFFEDKVATSSSNFSVLDTKMVSNSQVLIIIGISILVLLLLILWRIVISKRGSREVSLSR
ncbi:hypothetical protein CMI41_01485 [Candidatus Pacearchaeota archaeon]|nr:hypothetical protein [Candidatus Pacearchaeota archaeon]